MEKNQKSVHRRNKVKYLPSYNIPFGNGDSLEIKPTANAWWKDQAKMTRLLDFLSMGCGISKSCKMAGISPRQYKYFVKEHPKFKKILEEFENQLTKSAEKTTAQNIKTDPKFALKHLMKKKPDEFPSPQLLKKMTELQSKIEEDRENYEWETRFLKKIIGMYREAFDCLPEEQAQKYAKIAEGMVIRYNREHRWRNKMIKRPSKKQEVFEQPVDDDAWDGTLDINPLKNPDDWSISSRID